MPIFDFECKGCGKTLIDELIPAKEQPVVPCPDCGKQMVKLVPRANFRGSGAGWHGKRSRGRSG